MKFRRDTFAMLLVKSSIHFHLHDTMHRNVSYVHDSTYSTLSPACLALPFFKRMLREFPALAAAVSEIINQTETLDFSIDT